VEDMDGAGSSADMLIDEVDVLHCIIFYDTHEIWKKMNNWLSGRALARGHLMQGCALVAMADECFTDFWDSSGHTIRNRKDGNVTKKTKDKSNLLFSSESTMCAHMIGHSVEGRIIKSARVEYGICVKIIEALSASIKLNPNTAVTGTRGVSNSISQKLLDSSLLFLRDKIAEEQYDVLSTLSNVNLSSRTKAEICALACSTFDGIPPKENKPILIMSCLALSNAQTIQALPNDQSIYAVALIASLILQIDFILLPAFKDKEAVTQSMGTTLINNLYGNLGIFPLIFSYADTFTVRHRQDCIGKMKHRISGQSLLLELSKNLLNTPVKAIPVADVVLTNFPHGSGANSNHQSALFNPLNLTSHKTVPYFHKFPIVKSSSTVAGSIARKRLMEMVTDKKNVEDFCKKLDQSNLGTKITNQLTRGTEGFFNNVPIQLDQDFSQYVNAWIELNDDFGVSDPVI
jgi:hypothetical protein